MTDRVNQRLLAIYLQDHLAAATGGVELFRRAARPHRGTPLGDTLEALVLEITSDRQAMLDVMRLLGVQPQPVKVAAAWAAEKVGRLKMNGSVRSRSPLSDVVELEAMRTGVEGKAAAWRLLQTMAEYDTRLADVDFAGLLERAQRQSEQLDRLRLEVARDRLVEH